MYWTMALLPFALLLLGFPIFLLLLATSFVVMIFFFPVPLTAIHQIIFNSLNKYALLAVPFFIFAGDLMSRGGISTRLLRWVASIIGGVRGSIPLTSLGFAALFGAISGVTTAATAAIGTLTYPRMREAGYSERFASALITAGGAIDNLIPPSIAMIIYGIASDTSIVALFAAGHRSGTAAGRAVRDLHLLSLRAGRHCRSRDDSRYGSSCWRPATASGRSARSASSSAASTPACSRRPRPPASPASTRSSSAISSIARSRWSELFETAARAMYLTGLIFIIVSVAGLYAWLLTISGIAQQAAAFITGMHAEPWMVLLTINVFLLFVGCFLDPASALIMLTPLLAPIAAADRRQSDPFRRHRRDEPDHRHVPSRRSGSTSSSARRCSRRRPRRSIWG